MNYVIIEMQTTNGVTAVVTPDVKSDSIEAEAVFLEKCAAARRSGLECHSVTLMKQTGEVVARKKYEM